MYMYIHCARVIQPRTCIYAHKLDESATDSIDIHVHTFQYIQGTKSAH